MIPKQYFQSKLLQWSTEPVSTLPTRPVYCVSVKYLKESVSKHRYQPVVWLLVSHAHKGAVQNKRLHLTFALSLPSYPSSCLSARAVSHTNTNATISYHPTVSTLVWALHHPLCSLQQWLRSWRPSFQTPSFLYSASRMILLDQSYAALQSPRVGSYFTCGKCLLLSMFVTSK